MRCSTLSHLSWVPQRYSETCAGSQAAQVSEYRDLVAPEPRNCDVRGNNRSCVFMFAIRIDSAPAR